MKPNSKILVSIFCIVLVASVTSKRLDEAISMCGSYLKHFNTSLSAQLLRNMKSIDFYKDTELAYQTCIDEISETKDFPDISTPLRAQLTIQKKIAHFNQKKHLLEAEIKNMENVPTNLKEAQKIKNDLQQVNIGLKNTLNTLKDTKASNKKLILQLQKTKDNFKQSQYQSLIAIKKYKASLDKVISASQAEKFENMKISFSEFHDQKSIFSDLSQQLDTVYLKILGSMKFAAMDHTKIQEAIQKVLQGAKIIDEKLENEKKEIKKPYDAIRDKYGLKSGIYGTEIDFARSQVKRINEIIKISKKKLSSQELHKKGCEIDGYEYDEFFNTFKNEFLEYKFEISKQEERVKLAKAELKYAEMHIQKYGILDQICKKMLS